MKRNLSLLLAAAAFCLLLITAGCVDKKAAVSPSPLRTPITVSIPPLPTPNSPVYSYYILEPVPIPTVSIGRIPGLPGD